MWSESISFPVTVAGSEVWGVGGFVFMMLFLVFQLSNGRKKRPIYLLMSGLLRP